MFIPIAQHFVVSQQISLSNLASIISISEFGPNNFSLSNFFSATLRQSTPEGKDLMIINSYN